MKKLFYSIAIIGLVGQMAGSLRADTVGDIQSLIQKALGDPTNLASAATEKVRQPLCTALSNEPSGFGASVKKSLEQAMTGGSSWLRGSTGSKSLKIASGLLNQPNIAPKLDTAFNAIKSKIGTLFPNVANSNLTDLIKNAQTDPYPLKGAVRAFICAACSKPNQPLTAQQIAEGWTNNGAFLNTYKDNQAYMCNPSKSLAKNAAADTADTSA